MTGGKGKQNRTSIDDIPIIPDQSRKTVTLFLYINHTLAITHNLYQSGIFLLTEATSLRSPLAMKIGIKLFVTYIKEHKPLLFPGANRTDVCVRLRVVPLSGTHLANHFSVVVASRPVNPVRQSLLYICRGQRCYCRRTLSDEIFPLTAAECCVLFPLHSSTFISGSYLATIPWSH